jgi:hypothetical protein
LVGSAGMRSAGPRVLGLGSGPAGVDGVVHAGQVLTVVDFADEAFIENADVQSGVGRRGDGVFVTVTLIGVKPGAVGVGCSAR